MGQMVDRSAVSPLLFGRTPVLTLLHSVLCGFGSLEALRASQGDWRAEDEEEEGMDVEKDEQGTRLCARTVLKRVPVAFKQDSLPASPATASSCCAANGQRARITGPRQVATLWGLPQKNKTAWSTTVFLQTAHRGLRPRAEQGLR